MQMTLRQVREFSREAWRRRREDWRMQLFAARAAQADDEGYRAAQKLLDAEE